MSVDIHPKFYQRWASIYTIKGKTEGWDSARAWARRTIPAHLQANLLEAINKSWGVKK